MHIVFAGDRQIAKPVGVAAASISRVVADQTVERTDVVVTIVGIAWTDQDLDFVVRAAPNVQVNYKSAEHLELPKVRTGRHVTSAAYLTLYLPELFPEEQRILYLDHDVMVRDERIWDLWKTNMEGYPVASVQAVGVPFIGSKNGIPDWRAFGLDPTRPIFNSGIMLLNPTECRKSNLTENSLRYATSEGETTRLADQQALNVALNGNWKRLPPIFNGAMKVLTDSTGAYSLWGIRATDEARDNPCIVHFLGRTKPWHTDCKTSFSDEWRVVAATLGWYPWLCESRSWYGLMPALQTVIKACAKRICGYR